MNVTCCERMAHDLGQTCDLHADRAACPDAMIARGPTGYGLYVRDGEDGHAASTIEIHHCPWCGARLSSVGDIDPSSTSGENLR